MHYLLIIKIIRKRKQSYFFIKIFTQQYKPATSFLRNKFSCHVKFLTISNIIIGISHKLHSLAERFGQQGDFRHVAEIRIHIGSYILFHPFIPE